MTTTYDFLIHYRWFGGLDQQLMLLNNIDPSRINNIISSLDPSHFFRVGNTRYYLLRGDIHEWLVDNNIKYILSCKKEDITSPHVIGKLSLFDADAAVLFKLTWVE